MNQFTEIEQRYAPRTNLDAGQRIEQICRWVEDGRTDVARMAAEIGLSIPTVRVYVGKIKRGER